MTTLIEIDGSRGEGGGQILRTSLALSVITGRPVQFRRIRAKRSKPGLRRQHLTAVNAAAEICGGRVDGARIGSTDVLFEPGPVRGGDYTFSIGSAGSASLVLQTVLAPLLMADEPSNVVLEGGTHNPMAPPFDFLQRCFLPVLAAMGARVELTLERSGFYPAGGGRMRAIIAPCKHLQPLSLMERGEATRRSAHVMLANLPEHIATRELDVVRERLDWCEDETRVSKPRGAKGPCNVLLLEVGHSNVTELVTAFGEKGVRAEAVAGKAVSALNQYLASDAPVGEHLADQLMVPLALAGEGRYRTLPLSLHSRTNIETIQRFVDVNFHLEQEDAAVVVSVQAG